MRAFVIEIAGADETAIEGIVEGRARGRHPPGLPVSGALGGVATTRPERARLERRGSCLTGPEAGFGRDRLSPAVWGFCDGSLPSIRTIGPTRSTRKPVVPRRVPPPSSR